MKTLFLTKTFTIGGAASGARNLLCALRAAGAEVVALDGYAAQRHHPIRVIRTAERIYERMVHDAETHCLRLGPPVFDLKRLYEQYKPDVIQLCDVSGNTIAFDDIPQVPCPVVHRMSDFWPYHGAHHYAEQPSHHPDLADRALRRTIFDGQSMPQCRVAPSQWLASRLGGADVRVIRNTVAVPAKIETRSPAESVVRFGFISGQIMDPRKGYSSLAPFLTTLARRSGKDVQLHAFGRAKDGRLPDIPGVEGILNPPFSSADLARVYLSFDILLCPSRLDNSPNVVTEALAHGTPIIGQIGTGMDSYIRQEFGGLVDFHKPSESALQKFEDMVQEIIRHFDQCSSQARLYARNELSPAVIGNAYFGLYESLLLEGGA